MERLMIQVPDKKSKLVKSLLKELGVVIEPNSFDLSTELNNMVNDGDKPGMDEIVAEIRAVRSKS
ncbi:hypothetical protein HDF24_08465 [Mucilaginibacter sp. X4EP1]|uniref:hypothetical protein n=1 Tax=Mucilaginibacter sp. X4EP1 TaxID=2723092 RepID=UPI0021693AE6|nr:hypothetical protein [Mucilaginibacter sp. X4EP1]MCS3813699.1 hypothetical protein [Mucilaginibacter sp. X4EP1]